MLDIIELTMTSGEKTKFFINKLDLFYESYSGYTVVVVSGKDYAVKETYEYIQSNLYREPFNHGQG